MQRNEVPVERGKCACPVCGQLRSSENRPYALGQLPARRDSCAR